MANSDFDVVTGAFGYTGKYIARRLLAGGRRVRTLTGHPNLPDPFGGQVDVAPLDFQDPAGLARSLAGATTLYNTYWVRFPRGGVTFERAVEDSRKLFRAAGEAGVRRIVHISITNADEASTLPYFSPKFPPVVDMTDSCGPAVVLTTWGLPQAGRRPAAGGR